MEKFQEIKEKILQLPTKTKMIIVGGFVAVCAIGALAYYISIPKLSDVERYKNNHDAIRMTKLIAETMKSGNVYIDVQNAAIQALAEMKDEKGNDFLLGNITSNANRLDAQKKENILNVLKKNDPTYVESKEDELFDYAADSATPASLRGSIIDILVRDSNYVQSNSDKLFNFAAAAESSELQNEIVKAIVEKDPGYFKKNVDKITEYVADGKFHETPNESPNHEIVEEMIRGDSNYIQTVANKILSEIPNNSTVNETTYRALMRFSINDETKNYIASRIRGNVASQLSDADDDSKNFRAINMLETLGLFPDSLRVLLEEYRKASSNLNAFDRDKDKKIKEDTEKINQEIAKKREEKEKIERIWANPLPRQQAVRIFVEDAYRLAGPAGALKMIEDINEQDRRRVIEYDSLTEEINSLTAEKENVNKNWEAERRNLEKNKNFFFNELKKQLSTQSEVPAVQPSVAVEGPESVGGVYLRMPRSKVENICGAPDSVENHQLMKGGLLVYATYNKDGLKIRYEGDQVVSITILKGSPLRFARSGLGPDNSVADYEKAYNITIPKYGPAARGNRIYDGEYLFLGQKDGVMLAIFDD